jgi:hypothetical protein|tara:strand:- start:63 stop:542 length:480 start_codon:yes stop_codon:yes gene_type:complete
VKLIIENWRQYLTEDKEYTKVVRFLKENNPTITEQEIETTMIDLQEKMPRWLKKLGTGAALATTLAGAGAPSQAYASDATPDSNAAAQQQEAPKVGLNEDGDKYTAKYKIGNDIQMAMEQADAAAFEGLGAPKGDAYIDARVRVGDYIYSTAVWLDAGC